MKKDAQVRDSCFFCTSPYQIIGAIAIVKSKRITADLYIALDAYTGIGALVNKLKESNIFSEVIVASIDTKKKGLLSRRIQSLKLIMTPEKMLSSYLPKNVIYRVFYSSSRSPLKSAQLAVLRKRNRSTKRVVFEDGIGSYSETGRLMEASGLRRLIERIIGWDLDDHKKMCVMLYCPELASNLNHLKDVSVEQMPRLEANKENRILLSDIFSVTEDNYIRERYIIFDTKRSGNEFDHLNSNEKRVIDSCYEIIRDTVGENVILKEHPRSAEKPKCLLKTYPYHSIPMEALYLSMKDLDKRVLISQVSTAVFTPKVLFDCEPIVICLHHLLKDNHLSMEFNSIFDRFRGTYKNQNRVYAPDTMDNLKQILYDIKDEYS